MRLPDVICKNQYTIRKVDAAGIETELARFHNVPLQVFYDVISGANCYSETSCVHSCWFGTGSKQPSSGDTALEKPLWTYSWNDTNCTSWEKYLNEDNHICHKYTFRVDADAKHVGTVSEVGIAFMKANNYGSLGLATHALILDSEGNPMTITKTDLEVLFVDVIFEFTLQDTEDFKWLPENYINFGSRSGSSWAPIFNFKLYNTIFFLASLKEDGFSIRLATLTPSKTYSNSNHNIITTGARLPQTSVTSQRYIKAIGIGNSTGNNIFGYWKLPNANVIPPKVLSGMGVGTGDGSTVAFDAPLSEWKKDTEEIYVDDVLQVRGVDYVCDNEANSLGLIECSIVKDMEYVGDYTTSPQAITLPILGTTPPQGGSFKTALWDQSHPTLKYAFPENAVKPVKRWVLANFIAYSSISSRSASYNSNWSGAVWTIKYSDDGATWETAGTATINSSNSAELVFDEEITARYWSFTISSRVTGILFAASSSGSIMAYREASAITFKNPPAAGAVIKMNATVECPMKNSNFIIDVNPTFEI